MYPVPNPKVISTASFTSNTFTYDQLYASDVISRAATLAGPAPGTVVPRGTVLMGVAPGLAQTAAYGVTGSQARAILAADVTMPAAGAANIIAYIQGKFLESGITWSAAGANSDAPQLWEFGVYVLDVMDRSGLAVVLPLDAKGNPTEEGRKKAFEDQIAAIRAAGPVKPPPVEASQPAPQPAWAEVAFENAVKPPPPHDAPQAHKPPVPHDPLLHDKQADKHK